MASVVQSIVAQTSAPPAGKAATSDSEVPEPNVQDTVGETAQNEAKAATAEAEEPEGANEIGLRADVETAQTLESSDQSGPTRFAEQETSKTAPSFPKTL